MLLYFAAGKNKEPDPGIIMYDVNGTKQTIPFSAKAVQGPQPKIGDKVSMPHSEKLLCDITASSPAFQCTLTD